MSPAECRVKPGKKGGAPGLSEVLILTPARPPSDTAHEGVRPEEGGSSNPENPAWLPDEKDGDECEGARDGDGGAINDGDIVDGGNEDGDGGAGGEGLGLLVGLSML